MWESNWGQGGGEGGGSGYGIWFQSAAGKGGVRGFRRSRGGGLRLVLARVGLFYNAAVISGLRTARGMAWDARGSSGGQAAQ